VIRAPLLAVAALAALAVAQASSTPTATVTRTGAVHVTLPSSMLQSKEVQKHMTSGLTTAFVVLASAGETEGGARITVRYELWDETYLVRTLDAHGKEQSFTVASQEKLAEWWRSTPLPVIHEGAAPSRVQLTVKVLPFSAREQAETQRWLSRLFTSMQSVKEAPVGKRSDAGAAKILDVIVSTSIQRRPILEYRWAVDAKGER
jgi:hypothetical protein